jgi:hypothetical protein
MFTSVAGTVVSMVKYAKTRHLTLLDRYPFIRYAICSALKRKQIPNDVIVDILSWLHQIHLRELVIDAMQHGHRFAVQEDGVKWPSNVPFVDAKQTPVVMINEEKYHVPCDLYMRYFRERSQYLCLICQSPTQWQWPHYPEVFCNRTCLLYYLM